MDDIAGVRAGSIVIGVDGSVSARAALDWAVAHVVAERRPITLVHAISPMSAVGWESAGGYAAVAEAMRSGGQELLRAARRTIAERAPEIEVDEVLRIVDPRTLLIELSEDASMVVLGSRGRGPVRSLLLGSVGVALSRHAHCPVVIHRPSNPGKVRRGVLVGVDGTEDAQAALEFAFAEASSGGLPLTVLHSFWDAEAATAGPHRVDVFSPEFEEQRLLVAESLSGLGEKFPDVRMELQLARGYPGDCLLRAGEHMNLIVVGARRGVRLASEVMSGSAATTVVEHATCAVAVVPTSSRS